MKPALVAFPQLTPSTKLVVAGGTAVVSVAKAFSENTALSWTDQVVVAWGAWGAFYWLRMTKQVGGRWGNAGASAHAVKWLAEFRLSQTRQDS